MTDTPARHRRPPFGIHQGPLRLLLLASAGSLAAGLGGCDNAPDEAAQDLQRAEYASLADCTADWGDERDCEPRPVQIASGLEQTEGLAAASAPPGATTGTGATAGGSSMHWHGPYYTRSGTVYRYDGRIQRIAVEAVRHAIGYTTARLTPSQVYATPDGRYATTPAHPQADAAKLQRGRGGFGGTGRLFSSSGG